MSAFEFGLLCNVVELKTLFITVQLLGTYLVRMIRIIYEILSQVEEEIRRYQEEIAKKDRLLSKLSRQVTYPSFYRVAWNADAV